VNIAAGQKQSQGVAQGVDNRVDFSG
jgi:GH25 family lysozyme M1 (1,4-beta-N-acetylmuramidase)